MTGNRDGLHHGLIAAATLIFTIAMLAWVSYRSPRIESILEGDAHRLIANGEIDGKIMKKFRITPSALDAALREHGLCELQEVDRAFVETDGRISVVPTKSKNDKDE